MKEARELKNFIVDNIEKSRRSSYGKFEVVTLIKDLYTQFIEVKYLKEPNKNDSGTKS